MMPTHHPRLFTGSIVLLTTALAALCAAAPTGAGEPPAVESWPAPRREHPLAVVPGPGAVAPYFLDGSLPQGPPAVPAEPVPECATEPAGCAAPGLWVSGEYLLWWVKDGPLPVPLVTTGPPDSLGVLGAHDTSVVGGTNLDYHAFSGGRFTLGTWLNDCQHFGLESSGFFLEQRPAGFTAASTSTGVPLLARPLVNPLTGAETSELVADPGAFAGSIAVRATARLYGWESNALARLVRSEGFSLDLLAGYRYLRLDEGLDILQNSTLLPGGALAFDGATVLPPGAVAITDDFATRNTFHGGQLGARAAWDVGRLSLGLTGKVALGATHQVGRIAGSTTLEGTGAPPVTVPGGVLALSSNSGRLADDRFSVVPELGLQIGWRLTPHLRATAGFSLLYWTDVARPGDLLDRTVNPTLLPTSHAFGVAAGPAEPHSALGSADFWAQGASLGLELRF
jgi:hypothetical protein